MLPLVGTWYYRIIEVRGIYKTAGENLYQKLLSAVQNKKVGFVGAKVDSTVRVGVTMQDIRNMQSNLFK